MCVCIHIVYRNGKSTWYARTSIRRKQRIKFEYFTNILLISIWFDCIQCQHITISELLTKMWPNPVEIFISIQIINKIKNNSMAYFPSSFNQRAIHSYYIYIYLWIFCGFVLKTVRWFSSRWRIWFVYNKNGSKEKLKHEWMQQPQQQQQKTTEYTRIWAYKMFMLHFFFSKNNNLPFYLAT